MSRGLSASQIATPALSLDALSKQALDVAKKAKRYRQRLQGDNHYGNKLAALRIEATNTFDDLASQSTGDTAALAELIEAIFSADTLNDYRAQCVRELSQALNTTWRRPSITALPTGQVNFFPAELLAKAKKSYVLAIGRQMNGAYAAGWYDAAAVMMRRLLEISIIEAFEAKGVAANIKDAHGTYYQLSELIARALAEPALTLSRNTKKDLPKLRDLGHLSAHSRMFFATREDVEKNQQAFRVALEEFLRIANLF